MDGLNKKVNVILIEENDNNYITPYKDEIGTGGGGGGSSNGSGTTYGCCCLVCCCCWGN